MQYRYRDKTDKKLTENNSPYQGSLQILTQCMFDLENDVNNVSVDSSSEIRLLNDKLKKAISDDAKSIENEK